MHLLNPMTMMMMMKRFTQILAAAAMALSCSAATPSSSALKVYDMEVRVDDAASMLDVDIDLRLADINLPANREIRFTPMVISADGSESVKLPQIIVAGRNRWYWYLRNGGLRTDDRRVERAGDGTAHVTLTEQVPFLPWMKQCTVEMQEEAGDCCATPRPVPGTSPNGLTELARVNTERPALAEEFVFAPPVNAGPVERELSGRAFVTFVVNRTELKPDYMINRRELAKIIGSIDQVRRDPNAIITHVHIKGFASPEGSWSNNVRLATGRTETLRRYVRDLYSFADTTITSSFEPEDWDGLASYVRDSMDYRIDHRAEILAMIATPMDPDERDHMIRRYYPQDYAVILKEIYPWLRHSDYTVRYSIRTFTTLEEIKSVYATDPSLLRNVDFYTLAQSYPEGSPEYCDVFEKAVEIYPDDPGSNLNAANIEMRRGDLDHAAAHLLKAGSTPHAEFARGVLAAKRGYYTEAKAHFEQARSGGIAGADGYLESIRAIEEYHPVTYSVERTKLTENKK